MTSTDPGEAAGPVPEANRPGHHPDHEQDQPDLEGFAQRLGTVPPEDRPDAEEVAPEAEGAAPEVEGAAPEVEDVAPEVEDVAPEVEVVLELPLEPPVPEVGPRQDRGGCLGRVLGLAARRVGLSG